MSYSVLTTRYSPSSAAYGACFSSILYPDARSLRRVRASA
ncbi:hypothetical protein TAEQ797_07935 [Taylorella equigenitalis]